jgi:hypothetical protein
MYQKKLLTLDEAEIARKAMENAEKTWQRFGEIALKQ